MYHVKHKQKGCPVDHTKLFVPRLPTTKANPLALGCDSTTQLLPGSHVALSYFCRVTYEYTKVPTKDHEEILTEGISVSITESKKVVIKMKNSLPKIFIRNPV